MNRSIIITIFALLLCATAIRPVSAQTNSASGNDIFTRVEQEPSFPGGEEARIKFIVNNLKYPESAKKNGIQGTVYVSFVVETDGYISNIQILRGIGSGCDEEVIRVMKLMPAWIPGKQNGKKVRVQYNMPVKFSLENKKTQ